MSAKQETINLIDLTIDEEVSKISSHNIATETARSKSSIFADEFRKSLDNDNPFDKAQRQVNYLDDPFEIVIQEVSQNCYKKRKEAETGNLLLMEEDILSNQSSEKAIPLKVSYESASCSVSSFANDSSFFENDSSKIQSKNMLIDFPFSENKGKYELEILNTNQFTREIDETDLEMCKNSETTDSPGSGKSKNSKSSEYKKRLLKLSLSNSLIKSPIHRQSSKSLENCSPMTAICKEADRLAIKMSEMIFDTPNSFEDSCDDLMSIEPKWVDSEGDVDSDIEMMNIPILKEINSLNKGEELSDTKIENDLKLSKATSEDVLKNLPSKDIDLESLREKVKSQRLENINSNDTASLISNLKNIISECSSDTKKSEANSLLETLSCILNKSDTKENKSDTKPPPKPIIRQGTFDIDLKKKEEDQILDDEPSKVKYNMIDGNQNEHLSPESNKSQKEEQNMSNSPEVVESDMSSIVEQIGRLLGNQNVNIVQANLTTPSKGNPTYIVVMNTPVMHDKKGSILFNNQENCSPEPLLSNTMRRRSQSLSIHDKSKLAVIKPQHQNENKTLLSGGGYSARRNSFSIPSNISTPCMGASARRSMYNLNRESSQKPTPRKLTLETHQEKYRSTSQVQIKPLAAIKPELNPRKFKLKANESVTRPQGPLKATIPIKNPIACSTPGNGYSPSRNLLKVKSRYSHLPTSPISRQPSPLPNRRRTMSEIKSPRKRIIESKTSIGISKPVIKPLKLTPGLSKAVNKLTPNKNSTKPIHKITNDNKENSKPSVK